MKLHKKEHIKFKIHHKKPKNSIAYFAILLLFFIFWTILIIYFSPETLINFIGIKNAYLIVFFLCIIGGISIMFPIPYYLAVFTFGAGGLNPILLGLSAALGLMIGDSTSYFLAYHGGKIIPANYQRFSKKVSHFIISTPNWVRYFILILWASVTPFPNDMMVIPLGLVRYPYLKTILPLGLGNIIFNTIVALSGYYGFSLFF